MKGVSILMYHQVGPFQPMKTHRSTYCHSRSFRLQMLCLKLMGFRVLDFETLLGFVSGEVSLTRPSVLLTFDDGYENFYEYAFPVLSRLGFPAMVYLLSGYLGKASMWFQKDGRPTPPLMTEERVRYLMDHGISFGSHGIGHKRLAEASLEEINREVKGSKDALERIFKRPFHHFCFPYGSFDERCMRIVREAGYRSAVTCVRGAVYPGADPYQLPRKAISYGDSLAGFMWKLFMKNKRKVPEIKY